MQMNTVEFPTGQLKRVRVPDPPLMAFIASRESAVPGMVFFEFMVIGV
jgi:hypothetical protein